MDSDLALYKQYQIMYLAYKNKNDKSDYEQHVLKVWSILQYIQKCVERCGVFNLRINNYDCLREYNAVLNSDYEHLITILRAKFSVEQESCMLLNDTHNSPNRYDDKPIVYCTFIIKPKVNEEKGRRDYDSD